MERKKRRVAFECRGMAGGAVVGSKQLMELFDFSGDPHHDRHERCGKRLFGGVSV